MAALNAIEKRLAVAMDKIKLRYRPQYGLFYIDGKCSSKYPCQYDEEWEGDDDEGENTTGPSCVDGVSSDDSDYCRWYMPGYYRYRLDFAVSAENLKIAVEVDGQSFHSMPDQIIADLKRQQEIEKEGWTFIRFKASDVYSHADRCARKIGKLISDMEEAQKARQQGRLLGRSIE